MCGLLQFLVLVSPLFVQDFLELSASPFVLVAYQLLHGFLGDRLHQLILQISEPLIDPVKMLVQYQQHKFG